MLKDLSVKHLLTAVIATSPLCRSTVSAPGVTDQALRTNLTTSHGAIGGMSCQFVSTTNAWQGWKSVQVDLRGWSNEIEVSTAVASDHPALGTVWLSAMAGPGSGWFCRWASNSFRTGAEFTIVEHSESVDLAWIGNSYSGRGSGSSWQLIRRAETGSSTDSVVSSLSSNQYDDYPFTAGENPPPATAQGRHRLLLPPGRYSFEIEGSANSSSQSIRAAVSFDTDGDGRPDLSQACPADADMDGNVDFGDLALVLMDFGTAVRDSDLDASGTVDAADLAIVVLHFGPCPSLQP
jgi:hypothetical protein